MATDTPPLARRLLAELQLADPGGRPLAEVRATRDEIARRVTGLLREL
jgi:hypothetical protein